MNERFCFGDFVGGHCRWGFCCDLYWGICHGNLSRGFVGPCIFVWCIVSVEVGGVVDGILSLAISRGDFVGGSFGGGFSRGDFVWGIFTGGVNFLRIFIRGFLLVDFD